MLRFRKVHVGNYTVYDSSITVSVNIDGSWCVRMLQKFEYDDSARYDAQLAWVQGYGLDTVSFPTAKAAMEALREIASDDPIVTYEPPVLPRLLRFTAGRTRGYVAHDGNAWIVPNPKYQRELTALGRQFHQNRWLVGWRYCTHRSYAVTLDQARRVLIGDGDGGCSACAKLAAAGAATPSSDACVESDL
jgi:hypothetical protein